MTQSKKLIVSVVAGMGVFCGLYQADAQSVSPNLAPVGSGAQVNGVTYGYGGTGTSANNYDEVTNANTNYAAGFQRTNDSAGALVWETSLSTGTPIYIGFQAADNPGVYGKYGVTNTAGNLAFNFPANSTLSSAPQLADFYFLTSTGIMGGSVTRNYISGTTNTGRGTDAWIYTPGVNTQNTSTGIYTPTVVNPQTSIADTNGDGITSNYFYTVASQPNNITASLQAVNNAQQAVGNSTRYTGTTATTGLGQDAWLSTQTSATTSSQILLGLGSGASTATGGYAYTSSGNIFRTSGVIASGTVANNRGLVDQVAGTTNGGEAAGTTNRYDDLTSAGTSSNTAGLDSWVYVPGSTTGVTQVGLAGAGSAYEVAAGGGLSSAVPFRYSKVTELNPSGQVAGTSWNFSGVPASGTYSAPDTSGWQAWVYTPSGTPSTSSTLGSNGYAQVGLTDLASGSTIGHAVSSSVTLPSTATFNGTNLYGTAANGYNLVSGLSNNGIAAGIALRFDSSGNTGYGQDAWVNTTNVSPAVLYAANSSSVSYYQPNVSNVAGPHTVATVTPAMAVNGLPSMYVNASQTAGVTLAIGYSNMSVLGMNSTGLTVGSIVRTDNGLNVGQDLWVYDPSIAKEFILAAPAASATNYGSITFQGVTDNGTVFGSYVTNANGTAASTTGSYLFDWSESTGFITLDQLYSGTAVSPTYLQLNNALAGQTNAYDLFNNGLSSLVMFGDSSGDLFLDGNTSAANGISNGAFEVSAVPEPTSVTLLMLGSAGLLSRRRRRLA